MLANYFTLFHIARELKLRYARTVIAQVYSQEKNTLSILLYAPEPHTITISCTARDNYILARSGDPRTQKNSVDLFPSLIDQHIESVYLDRSDRILYIQLSGNQWLCLEMFASKANVILCNEQGIIIDVFLNKKEMISASREFQHSEQPITIDDIVKTKEQFCIELCGDNSEKKSSLQLLKKSVPKLGTTLAEEIIFRSNIHDRQFSMDDAEKIYTVSQSIIRQLLESKKISPIIYFDEKSPVCFSLFPLEQMAEYQNETFDNIFSGIQKFISVERSSSSFRQKKNTILSWLEKEYEKSERTIRAVETELSESARAEQYELFAQLIMAHLQSVTKGLRTITVENSFSHNEIITIPLDPMLSPVKNAERYHEKAKKSKSAKKESGERLIILKKRAESLYNVLEKINGVNDGFSLKNFLQSYGGMVNQLGYMTEKEQAELPPFKIFAVEGGFTVYAGKNSVNNDLLTFRFSKPNDLWFHARGSSGSHVVLKVGSAQGTPSKKAIEQTASIAAYYSKMKNAKHVPVAMTERKYIHKPKGASAGTVALDKEKVIFVQPMLPESTV